MNEFTLVITRVLRVGATFVVLSVLGCLLGYFVFHLPLTELSAAVAVPILWVFAISRAFVLTLPGISVNEKNTQIVNAGAGQRVIFCALTAAFLSGVAAIDFLLSAGTFLYLGLHDLASRSFRLAGIFGLVSTALVLILSAVVVRKYVRTQADALVVGVWRILRWPARLADSLPHMPKLDH